MPDSYDADYYRAMAYRNSPEYAWQQQLASGANLAKNLNWQTLLGLTLGTGLGYWLGDRYYNWQRAGDDARQYGKPNPGLHYAIRDALFPQGDANLGWQPQYPFPTANKLFTDRVTPNIDWRQNNRQQPPYFQMPTPKPAVPATPTQTTTSETPQPITPVPAPTPTSIPQQYSLSPSVEQALGDVKSIYDDWRLNHENNRQRWVDRPFS